MKIKHLLILFFIINLICLGVSGLDKRLSKNGDYNSPDNNNKRIAETSLITYSAFGGALGSLAGFYVFHHKISAKKGYLRRDLFFLIIQNFIFYLLIYKVFKKQNE